MYFKHILKNTFCFALLSSFALIKAKRNDCEEIENYIVANVKDYRKICDDYDIEMIRTCEVNDNGQLTNL